MFQNHNHVGKFEELNTPIKDVDETDTTDGAAAEESTATEWCVTVLVYVLFET